MLHGYPLDYQGSGRPFPPLAEPGSGRGKTVNAHRAHLGEPAPGPPGETLPPVRQSPVREFATARSVDDLIAKCLFLHFIGPGRGGGS